MPLYKRKPFPLLEKPEDLKPDELVFRVRFTKEIFRDYSEYLNRLNLYRQRVWTCKCTGKSNLTYEEALVSEKRATEKVQRFPKELVEPVLRDVQFSMLNLKELVNSIAAKLQEQLFVGTELYGRKNNRIYPCRIVKVLEEEVDKTQYQVAWLDKDKKVTESDVINEEDLIKKKLPFGRDILKSFIRESTCRSVPWVLHDKLAYQYGISTDPPEDLRSKLLLQDGITARNKKRKNDSEGPLNEEVRESIRKKKGKEGSVILTAESSNNENGKEHRVPLKYPIDDLLLQHDLTLAPRPPPTRDFSVPLDCVGDLLMVWDFCSSFGRLLNLSPFSLEHFENALCHKDSNIVLIMESQSAILRLLLKEEGEYLVATQKKNRRPKITIITWKEYLCDFLEMSNINDVSTYISMIRRGHYGLLDVHAKLAIFRELVSRALETVFIRGKLDELIQERQELAATRRELALEEGRKKREKKELAKVESDGIQMNGSKKKVLSDQKGNKTENSKKQGGSTLEKHVQENDFDEDLTLAEIRKSSVKRTPEMMVDEKEAAESTTQKKDHLQREIDKRFIRTSPLGKDRDYNRYWFFRREARVFVESSDSSQWGYYTTKDQLDSLIDSLNPKGVRERALERQLKKTYDNICMAMQKKSKEVAHLKDMDEAALRRSSRVRAPPRENPALAFLNYTNIWKDD